MGSKTKTYFISPNWEFAPDGLIQLGSIITDPTDPKKTLNDEEILPITSRIYPSELKGWEKTRTELFSANLGIWATFLQMMGFGGEASVNTSTESTEVYKVGVLETKSFKPDKKYIWDSLQNEYVKDYLSSGGWNIFSKPAVYMITGTKIAKGFSVETTNTKERSGDGNVGLDATALGVPLQVGPKVKIVAKKADNTGFKESSDCVFAYQLLKIQKKNHDEVNQKDYNRGALLSDGQRSEKTEDLESFEENWEVADVSEAPDGDTDTVEQLVDEDY